MRVYVVLILVVFGFAQVEGQCDPKPNKKPAKTEKNMPAEIVKFDKLPDGANLDDRVREIGKDEAGQVISDEIITVEEKLRKLGAKYVDETLVDADGKEIRFYRPPVRGASQGFEEDRKQAERDARELAELREKYSVIILYRDPKGVM